MLPGVDPPPSPPKVFFGYPSRPELARETLDRAARSLEKTGLVRAETWEELAVTGRLVIDQITTAILDADVSLFDVTTLNENVLFEVGFAITSDRQLWLVRDTTNEPAAARWREFGLLETIGYASYTSAIDIQTAYLSELPHTRRHSLFAESFEPLLSPLLDPTVFYVRSPITTEAERELTRRIERVRRGGIKVTVADPRESRIEALQWYVNHCYLAAAVVVHIMAPTRRGAAIHNARCALVAGLAHGFGRPVLMLAEHGYTAPLDYRNLLYIYHSARECRERADYWLTGELQAAYALAEQRADEAARRSLSTELASIRLGEHVAENEEDALGEYFVPTHQYKSVLAPHTTIFVGRKGVGKTANMLRAAEELGLDRRNLVCKITPADYDLEGLVRVLEQAQEMDSRGFLVEALWKFLLYTEIAFAAVQAAQDRPAGIGPGSPVDALARYLGGASDVIDRDFSVRLERAVNAAAHIEYGRSIEGERAHISEALHSRELRTLVALLVPVFADYKRIAILVDNLDQSWGQTQRLDLLSVLLLGLLGVAGRAAQDLAGRSSGGLVTVGVFIRSDIYFHVAPLAREPDKLPTNFMTWHDAELLLQVPEERFSASHDAGTSSDELWTKYFVPDVHGVPVRDYLASRALPRPRDILVLVNAAIDSAVRHRRTRVGGEDVLAAERVYSQFAFDALLVEAAADVPDIEDVLFEFAGMPERVVEADALAAIAAGKIQVDRARDILERLIVLTFFGLEVRDGEYEFAETPRDLRRIDALSRRLAQRRGEPRSLRVHPAFQPYLDILGDESLAQQMIRFPSAPA